MWRFGSTFSFHKEIRPYSGQPILRRTSWHLESCRVIQVNFMLFSRFHSAANYVGTSNTTPNSQPFTVEAVIAGTKTTSGSIENCLTWCTVDLDCSLCSISDGGVSLTYLCKIRRFVLTARWTGLW